MTWGAINDIIIIASFLVLALQARALRMQIVRGEMQSVYDRYLEITKIEIRDPDLHKMFLYGKDFARFSALSVQELHRRALSLLIFDQFALIFNMSHERQMSRSLRWLRDHWLWTPVRHFIELAYDRRRSIWEINSDYVSGVLTNPLLIQSWREWGLGETWRGSEFYQFVESIIDAWEAQREE